jgi:hypothetical protein
VHRALGYDADGNGPGDGDQVSAQPPAKKTAGLIEKETLKKRISNND